MSQSALEGVKCSSAEWRYRAWLASEFKVSDVSIAFRVHYDPRPPHHNSSLEGDKEDLYALIGRVIVLAEDYGLERPVCAVLTLNSSQGKHYYREFRRWSSDQDWHRGRFLLYVHAAAKDEIDEPDLGDLVEMAPPALVTSEKIEGRTKADFIRQFKEEARKNSDIDRELIERIINWILLDGNEDTALSKEAMEKELTRYLEGN